MNEGSARALLGVPRSATPGQIKRAYRRRALELHPDHGGDQSAFQQLVAAQQRLLRAAPTTGRSNSGYFTAAQATAARRPPSFQHAPARRTHTPVATPPLRFGDVLAEKLAAA